ncbi:protein-disulfide reductase DsbD family protein [Sphingomonas oligophenolica]|uniref:Thiol:disulfide interchange protein n=1 Tax=Sphingomonas oligophenolica TaxID=301154 RepID=A0A502CN03_9SPHN|nr:thiol:disulfide interchange protein [Sphingomonas oligophenolica]
MRALGCALMTLVAVWAIPTAAQAPLDSGPHLAMRLVAESDVPRAGEPVMLAIETRPEPGWHGYWRNPGDAGLPSQFAWTLPKGAAMAGEVAWPVPTTLLIAGLMNYVYEAPYAPLVTLNVPVGIATGTRLPIKVAINYLVCTTSICVPEAQTLTLDLTVGDGHSTARAAFDRWRAAIPKPLDAAATYAVKDGALAIAVPLPASARVDSAYFFPITPNGAVDYAAPQTVTRDGDRLLLTTKGKPTGPIEGVLRIGANRGLAIAAQRGTVAASDGGGGGGGGAAWLTLVAFVGAVLGGLILNIMPCVFPILSLKALNLARGGADERGARVEALAYTAGVVLVCVGLGAAILALRAGGSAVGWAFQLQNPKMIVALLLLSVGIALNLAGLFEMPMPRFAGEGGVTSSFATGALAAFVATPCTGPFMGAALGAALILPWYAALAVFAGLGIGLALPFLLIGFVPALRRRLPKPGAWMEAFRRVLSIPMWLTAIALAWVLGRQAGVDGMTFALVAALAAALVLWTAGARQRRGLSFGWIGVVGLVVITGSTIMGVSRSPVSAAIATVGAEPFSEARLGALRQEGKPVFVYFTADWCLTCKVNEKAAIETAGVRDAFAKHGVAVLVGDWTDGDATLGRFIQAHNRAGVPLYLFYPKGAAEPRVLPQVLTPGMLMALQ